MRNKDYKKLGRPFKINDELMEKLVHLLRTGKGTISEIEEHGISRYIVNQLVKKNIVGRTKMKIEGEKGRPYYCHYLNEDMKPKE